MKEIPFSGNPSTCSCILCKASIPSKTKPEHVLLNALGGRLTAREIICPDCNHRMGIGPDNDLANSTTFLRNICGLKAGDGDVPPQIRGLEAEGNRIDLKPGMQPQMRPRDPMSVDISETGIEIRIEAYSDTEAEKLAEGAARKIAKHFGHKNPKVIEAFKRDILKDRKSTFRPAPAINQSVEFGTGRSQQAMAKAALVLWAMEVGNEEVISENYDPIRQFIENGDKPTDPEESAKIDTRPLPELPSEYGLNSNIIWAGSDNDGRVFGYYRLFGAIGWRFRLADAASVRVRQVCLISNPFDPRMWKRLSGDASPIDLSWVSEEWDSWPPQFEQVQKRIEAMAAHAHNLSKENWLRDLVKMGLEKSGCKEGDIITKDHIRSFAKQICAPLAAHILKTDVPDNS